MIQNTCGIFPLGLPPVLLVILSEVCLLTKTSVLIRLPILVVVVRIWSVGILVNVTGIWNPLTYIRRQCCLLNVNRQVVCLIAHHRVT